MTSTPRARRPSSAVAPHADPVRFAAARVIEIDSDDPRVRRAAEAALAAAGVADGHLAIELVDAARIRELNREHRGTDRPTDVLSFPIDEDAPTAGPRELGDVVICPEHTEDLVEAVVHGVLHLCGYDHEADDGEMLALQDHVMESLSQ
jgi:probable rRNA maturation factor